jgi:hypothetical protein
LRGSSYHHAMNDRVGVAGGASRLAKRETGGLERAEAERFLRSLRRVLDDLHIIYLVEEGEDGVRVKVPLDHTHLPRRVFTPRWVGGRKWHDRLGYEAEGRIEDWLLLLAERIAEKMGYGSVSEMPYFEPMDLTWCWRVPREGLQRGR